LIFLFQPVSKGESQGILVGLREDSLKEAIFVVQRVSTSYHTLPKQLR
jgi:hypothetical protein